MPAGGTPHDPTAYHRYIEVLDSDASDQVLVLSDRSTGVSLCKSASFELLRQGGCGGGSFTLLSRFPYDDITNGMYIRCKYTSDGDPVYLGRIEEITVDSPSTVTIRTEGPMSLLNNIRVGGFDSEDQRLPHLYAATDQFIYDPDWNLQSWDFTNTVPGLIQKLFDQYISIRTPITLGTIYSYPPSDTVAFNSSVFRGQETLGPLIRALAIQQLGASYGVDANNQFFFIPQNTTELAYFQEGKDLFKLQSSRDLSLLYNELHITGDYVYDLLNQNKLYKFYSTHASASSIAAYGPRKVTLYLPWIRTRADADAFASAFFNIYANVTTRYNLTTVAQGAVLVPWMGTLGLKDKDGVDIVRAEPFDRIEFQWDHAAIPSVAIGPEDLQFPQAPDPGRWELANQQPQDFSFESSSVSDSSSSSSQSSSESSSNESSSSCMLQTCCEAWAVTLTGLGDNNGATCCDDWEGTFILTKTTMPWNGFWNGNTGCSVMGPFGVVVFNSFQLSYGAGHYVLQLRGNSVNVNYTLTADFVCARKSLELSSSLADCRSGIAPQFPPVLDIVPI